MSISLRTHRRIKTWLPRVWGFTLGAAALLVGGFLVSLAFSDTAERNTASDLEFVYPYEL